MRIIFKVLACIVITIYCNLHTVNGKRRGKRTDIELNSDVVSDNNDLYALSLAKALIILFYTRFNCLYTLIKTAYTFQFFYIFLSRCYQNAALRSDIEM